MKVYCIVWGKGVLEGIFLEKDEAINALEKLIRMMNNRCSVVFLSNSIMISTISDGSRNFRFKEWDTTTQQVKNITVDVMDQVKKYMSSNRLEYTEN